MIASMVLPVTALAGACLLWLGRWAGSRAEVQPDRNRVVAMHLRYQPAAATLAAVRPGHTRNPAATTPGQQGEAIARGQ